MAILGDRPHVGISEERRQNPMCLFQRIEIPKYWLIATGVDAELNPVLVTCPNPLKSPRGSNLNLIYESGIIRYNPVMARRPVSPKAKEILLQDAIQRDLATARRAALLEILWHERYLTRDQLIARVEIKLGKSCFGTSAWEDNFYRDLRVVKRAFKAAGQQLQYSRNKRRPGYYLKGQPALSHEFRQTLISSAAEVDPRQIELYHRLLLSERIRQGCSISNTARTVVAYRIRQENPGIDPAEANRLALQSAYSA